MAQPSFDQIYPRVTLTVASGQTTSPWVQIAPPDDTRDVWAFTELITPAAVDAATTVKLEYSDNGTDALATQNTTGDLAGITLTAAAAIALAPTQYSVVHKYVRIVQSGAAGAARTYQLVRRRV